MQKHTDLDPFLNSNKNTYLTWLVIVAMIFFYSFTIREGHNWNGDFAHFIHHAKNMVEGNSYHDVHYIINPYYWLSPIVYPPVMPAILAPLYFFFGLNLTIMKLMMIAFFAVSLIVINKVYKHDLSTFSLLVLTVCLAFNPYYWDFKDRILSEYPYLLFSMLSLFLMQRSYAGQISSKKILTPIALGIVMYLAYGTREIGIVLPITVLTFEIINFRKITRIFIISVAVFSLLAMGQHYAIQNDYYNSSTQQQLDQITDRTDNVNHNHIAMLDISVQHIAKQVRHYYISLQGFFYFPTTTVFSSLLFYSTCLFSVIGFFRIIRKRLSIIDIYPLGYIAVLLLFAGEPRLRYLMPVIPFFLYYALIGIQTLRLFGIRHIEAIFVTGIFIATIISYVQSLTTISYDRIERSVKTEYSMEMFDYISSRTDPSDVIIFREPRIMGLFTDRDASIYPESDDPDFLLRYMDVIEADYIVSRLHTDDQSRLMPLINKRIQYFTPVLQNEEFIIYRYEASKSP